MVVGNVGVTTYMILYMVVGGVSGQVGWGDSDEYIWNSPAYMFLLIHQLLTISVVTVEATWHRKVEGVCWKDGGLLHISSLTLLPLCLSPSTMSPMLLPISVAPPLHY